MTLSTMEKDKRYLLRQALFEKIADDHEIQLLAKKLNIQISEKSVQAILKVEDPELEFLAVDEISKEISELAISEFGFDHSWFVDNGESYACKKQLGDLRNALEVLAIQMCSRDDGGAYCICPGAATVELLEYIRGRKQEKPGLIEIIRSEDISRFFDRMLNPDSLEKIPLEDIKSLNSDFAKALRLMLSLGEFNYPFRTDLGFRNRRQREILERVGIREIIRKHWSHGLEDCPSLPMTEILFFYPELWSVVKGTVDLRRVHKALNGCLGLDDFYQLRDYYLSKHEVSGLSCFSWFPEIVEAEQDSINWTYLSRNASIDWTESRIRSWSELIDFQALSGNHSVRWTKELIQEYRDEWHWGRLSLNETVPWDADLLHSFEERLDWDKLSENDALPWSEELLDKFADKWKWRKHEKENDYRLESGVYHKSWRAYGLSSNEGIKWTPELLTKHEKQLDSWALAAKGRLDANCVRHLFSDLHECRTSHDYRAKYSDYTDDIYSVSLSGWHLLFGNPNASIDASLLDEIYQMQFKATPNIAVRGQRWTGPILVSALDVLFPGRYRNGTKLNFDVGLTECIERGNTWGKVLVKSALSQLSSSSLDFGRNQVEREFAPLLSDIRSFLRTRRTELFDLKLSLQRQNRELLKDEIELKKVWYELIGHTDFEESMDYLKKRDTDLSIAEAQLALFVIHCRCEQTITGILNLQRFGLSPYYGKVHFKNYADIADALKANEELDNAETEIFRLKWKFSDTLKRSAAFFILREYNHRWQPVERNAGNSTYTTIAEVIFLPEPSTVEELLCSVLKSLGFKPDENFNLSSHERLEYW